MKLKDLLEQLGVETYGTNVNADLNEQVCVEVAKGHFICKGELLQIEKVERNTTTACHIHILVKE